MHSRGTGGVRAGSAMNGGCINTSRNRSVNGPQFGSFLVFSSSRQPRNSVRSSMCSTRAKCVSTSMLSSLR
ncbi:hypothetical protein [Kibdelosporangium aridum]|uniref:hypothetical protein n=1 Tax=Kibdelosporangium aridum TaxID=2030 RepID=UPI0005244B78